MKRLCLFIAIAISFSNLNANTVTADLAKTVAANFYTQNSSLPASSLSLAYTERGAGTGSIFYVFNVNEHDGFVIVSADDHAYPIIGFSDRGSFVVPAENSNVGWWLKSRVHQIDLIKQSNAPATDEIAGQWNSYINNLPVENNNHHSRGNVNPLLQTTWDQYPYYNAMCPSSSVTGCVATTMGQIMKYWSYPAHGLSSSCYYDAPPMYTENYGSLCADYGSTNYNWAVMPNNIYSPNNQIATLLYQCGVSVDMDYSPSGSGAMVITADAPICAQSAFVQNFGYDGNKIQGLIKSNYSYSNWVTKMENELNNDRPVEYVGADFSYGGHTWVCDGYNSQDQFHMNWGWSGIDDGYYELNTLNPNVYDFSNQEEALIGIQPPVALASFTASPTTGCGDLTVNFTDRSMGPNSSSPITSWQWSFPGGSPSSSTVQNPTVTYSSPGSYNVTEIVTDNEGSDTIQMSNYISVNSSAPLPLAQDFQATFPPSGWSVNNPDNHPTVWAKYLGAGGYGNSNSSMYFDNCVGGVAGQRDQVYTPTFDLSSDNNPTLFFDVAYTPYDASFTDSLAVYYSTDCGATQHQIYLKGGMSLCTTGGVTVDGGANTNNTGCFVPLSNNWRTDTIHIADLAGASSAMFIFENRSGYGTNMYVDNINVPGYSSTGLEDLLNDNSIVAYPNPSNGNFDIGFHSAENKTYSLYIYNMLGEELLRDNLSGQSGQYDYPVDLSKYGKGVYSVVVKDGQNKVAVKKVVVF